MVKGKMTKYFVLILVVLTIYVTIECLAQSPDDAEPLANQKDDIEATDTDDVERMGMSSAQAQAIAQAQAQAYASVTRQRPGLGVGTQIKFVNCFTCVDCPHALVNTTSKYCPHTNDPTKTNKCVVYAEKYIQMKKLWYIRGCASERGSCADIKKGHENTPSVKLSFCSECEGDRCNTNGVSRSTSDITTALFVLILSPILGKYTLT